MAAKSKLIIDFIEEETQKSRTCSIILDEQTLGNIAAGERKEFDINPGKHSLFITRKNFNSIDCQFEAEPNKEIYLEIRFEPLEPYPKKFEVIVNDMSIIDSNPPRLKRN